MFGDNKFPNIQTVFNCALNPAMKKRKKIPRVIPPPPTAQQQVRVFKTALER